MHFECFSKYLALRGGIGIVNQNNTFYRLISFISRRNNKEKRK